MYQVLKNHIRCFIVSGRIHDHQYNTTYFPINCFVQAPSTAHYGESKTIEATIEAKGQQANYSADLQQQRRQGGVREGQVKPDERVLQGVRRVSFLCAGTPKSSRPSRRWRRT